MEAEFVAALERANELLTMENAMLKDSIARLEHRLFQMMEELTMFRQRDQEQRYRDRLEQERRELDYLKYIPKGNKPTLSLGDRIY